MIQLVRISCLPWVSGVFVDCIVGLSSETYVRFQPTELDKELSEKVEKDDKTLGRLFTMFSKTFLVELLLIFLFL